MRKRNYSSFKAIDFLLDERFYRWMKTGDPALTTFWNDWSARNPHRRRELEKAQTLFHSLAFTEKPISKEVVDAEWAKLEAAMAPGRTSIPKLTARETNSTWRWWLTAASVLFFVSWGYRYFVLLPNTEKTNNTLINTTLRGQRVELLLSDGTRVLLNSGSTLRYPKTFTDEKREVTLEGEAYFEVAPNPDAPFLITSGDVTTEVVGTSFGIAAYPGNDNVHVAVVSGKVNVYSSEKANSSTKVTLIPNQMATFEPKDKAFVISPFEQEKQLAWVEGVLYFEKDDFHQVMARLENWYGITVLIDPTVTHDEGLLLTGKFKNKPLEYILDSYRYPGRFNYTIRNDTLIIH